MSNPLNTKESIGSRIKALRAKADMTQAKLAEKLNLTDKAVSKWESGEGAPNVEVLADLASLLGTTTDYLLTGKDPNQPKPVETKPVVARTEEENLGILASTIEDGYYSIDKVVALNDFDLYQFALIKPVCVGEDLWGAAKARNWRRVFQLAVDHDFGNLAESVMTNKLNEVNAGIGTLLCQGFIDYYGRQTGKVVELVKPNVNYFAPCHDVKPFPTSCEGLKEGKQEALDSYFSVKHCLRFDSIWPCTDIRFFEIAVKTDGVDLDKVLARAVKTKPEDYALQSLLLDHGAKLHHLVADPYDDEAEASDVPDEVATQLLKNQLAILAKKGN
jgi:transcriptional regulator with XRE-family HTH domain